MERKSVVSTNIASIGYDVGTAILEIEFLNGAIYQYYDVPKQVYDELINAGSHGSYLSSNIKGHYQYARL